MTKLLETAIEAARKLPAERQNELAEVMLAASGATPYILAGEELAAVTEGLADAEAGRFATDENIENILAKHRIA